MSSKIRRAAALVAAGLALPAVPAQAADESGRLAPSSEWSVSSDGESCLIVRRFGGEGGVSFGLQAFSPNASLYNTIVRGDPLPHRDAGALDIEYRYGRDAQAVAATGLLGGGRNPRVTFFAPLEPASVLEARRNGEPPSAADAAREAAIDEFAIAFSRGRPLVLQLGSMAAPLRQLRECAATLPEKWGMDPAVQRSLSRPAVPLDMGSWLGPGNYPWEYLRNGLSVRVHLRLMTDERGAVSRCVVQAPRGDNIAGTVACSEIAETARFEPALDAEGRPVASYFTTSIFFNTPRSNGPLRGESRTQGL